MSELLFTDCHATWRSQLAALPEEVPDTEEVAAARQRVDLKGLAELGAALDRQLRYRESAAVYTRLLDFAPEDGAILRLRAGRYLSTLQWQSAELDFLACLNRGGELMELLYRLGLCAYFGGNDLRALLRWEDCFPLCGDEMGIAVIYWHTLAAWRSGRRAGLLSFYHSGMEVGHHTGYEKAVAVMCGARAAEELAAELAGEPSDLEFSMAQYGLCALWRQQGQEERCEAGLKELLRRDSFWPSFAWIGAWNDQNGMR